MNFKLYLQLSLTHFTKLRAYFHARLVESLTFKRQICKLQCLSTTAEFYNNVVVYLVSCLCVLQSSI